MLTVRTSENTVITSFRLISERQDFSSVRTGENTVRARARIHAKKGNNTKSCEDTGIEIKRFFESDLEPQRHRHDVVGSGRDGRYECIK